MNEKLVSVIIPTYNRANLIKETINSVLKQTYQNFEILIIDDGSTDNTKALVESFNDKRIRYIWQNHSGFPGLTRNNGIKFTRGEYIAFLDSDDLWLPKKLEKQIKIFYKNPDILLISTNGIIFPSEYVCKFFSIQNNKRWSFRELLKKNIIITSSILMKKKVIDTIGLMDENLRNFQDYDYWLRLLKYKDKSILVLKNIMIKHRLHESNITEYKRYKDPKYLLKRYKLFQYIFNKYKDYDQNYIRAQLKPKLYQLITSKMEQNLMQNEINLLGLLKNRYMKKITKLSVLMRYYNKKYFNFIKIFHYNHPNFYKISFFKKNFVLKNSRLFFFIEK